MRRTVAAVLVAIVAVACTGIDAGEEFTAANEFAETFAGHLADALERGEGDDLDPVAMQQLLHDVELPTAVEAVNVLDAGVSWSESDGELAMLGVDAAAAVQFIDREGPVCVHLAAVSNGESNAVVADHISVTECAEAEPSDLQAPEYVRSQQLFRPDD